MKWSALLYVFIDENCFYLHLLLFAIVFIDMGVL